MENKSKGWESVEELARLSKNIPPERRENSTVRRAVQQDRAETVARRTFEDLMTKAGGSASHWVGGV